MSRVLRVRVDGSHIDGEVEFEERLPPEFLDLPQGDELSAASDILVSGRAYRASEWIMIQADVTVSMCLPCSMCNDMCTFSIELTSWEQSLPASSMKDGMIDLSEVLREAILLEVPFFVRCCGDTCRNDDEFRKYCMSENKISADDVEERNQPFLSLL